MLDDFDTGALPPPLPAAIVTENNFVRDRHAILDLLVNAKPTCH
jgi:hypothetical protein